MTTITRDDWLKALADAEVISTEDDQNAITIGEFAAMFGTVVSTASARLEKLVAAGKAVRTVKNATTPYGRRIQYVAYRLVP